MNQTIEHVALDNNTVVSIITTQLTDDIQLVTCERDREATIEIRNTGNFLWY